MNLGSGKKTRFFLWNNARNCICKIIIATCVSFSIMANSSHPHLWNKPQWMNHVNMYIDSLTLEIIKPQTTRGKGYWKILQKSWDFKLEKNSWLVNELGKIAPNPINNLMDFKVSKNISHSLFCNHIQQPPFVTRVRCPTLIEINQNVTTPFVITCDS
jgi:hypothetical protein